MFGLPKAELESAVRVAGSLPARIVPADQVGIDSPRLRPDRLSAAGSERCRRPGAASARASRRSRARAARRQRRRPARPRGPRPRARSRARSRRSRRDGRAGAARSGTPRPRPTRPRAASARPPARSASRARRRRRASVVLRDRQPLAGRAPPRRRRGATRRPRRAAPRSRRPRTCSSPCGTSSPRPRASRRRPRRTSSRERLSALPVTSQSRACERPRRLERQRRRPLVADAARARRPSRRREHELERLHRRRPPVCAAWNDVPQPVKTTRAPSGSRRSVGTARSHSGCAAIAVRVRSPAIARLYTMPGDGGLRAPRRCRTACASSPRRCRTRSRSSCFVMLAAGSRYETRRDERDRALRRAHVLQGHRAAADRA